MKERKTKRTNKKSKKIGFNDRAGFIVNAFREMPEKRFTLKYLAAASGGADKEGRNLTKHILDTLLEQGYIEAEGKGKYHLSRSKMPRYEGVVDMAASGAMYVQCEELENDVFVHQRNTHNALNGDRVEVIVTHTSRNGALEGEIAKVLERSPRCYAGRVEIASKTMAIVVPDSRKMPVDIAISLKRYPNIKQDDKVAVRIIDWREGDRLPQGELVDVLGAAGDNDAEMHAILLEYNLPYKFEEQVERAANAIDGRITERDIAERRDMRRVPTLTIDPADAKDFALWFLQESDTGYCVHYASATAVLLRAAGIPSRYVSGYLVKTQANTAVDVHHKNAHAWVEYYIPGVGWMMLESTASGGDSPVVVTQPQETTEPEETSQVTTQPAEVETTQEPTEAPAVTDPREEPNQSSGRGWIVLLALAGAMVALLVQWRLRVSLRRRNYRKGKPNAQALNRWREVALCARLLGVKPDPQLHALAQKAKFSRETITPQELRQFEQYLQSSRDKLKKKPLWNQLVYTLIFALY